MAISTAKAEAPGASIWTLPDEVQQLFVPRSWGDDEATAAAAQFHGIYWSKTWQRFRVILKLPNQEKKGFGQYAALADAVDTVVRVTGMPVARFWKPSPGVRAKQYGIFTGRANNGGNDNGGGSGGGGGGEAAAPKDQVAPPQTPPRRRSRRTPSSPSESVGVSGEGNKFCQLHALFAVYGTWLPRDLHDMVQRRASGLRPGLIACYPVPPASGAQQKQPQLAPSERHKSQC